MLKKSFFRHGKAILAELEAIAEQQGECMHCVQYIIDDLKRGLEGKKGCWGNAYHWCKVEADKIRHTPFAKPFYRYGIYETHELFSKRSRYRWKRFRKNRWQEIQK